jgi:hypothetical protein
LPTDKQELDALCIRLQKADPQMQDADNSLSNHRQAALDPNWFYYTVCGFCRSVCAAHRADRSANYKLIKNSGTAALKLDGSHTVADERRGCRTNALRPVGGHSPRGTGNSTGNQPCMAGPVPAGSSGDTLCTPGN